MLQDIRDNAQSTVAKVIVGLIVLTFALFGVDSIVGGFGGEPEVAVVNDNEIKEIDFVRAVEVKRRQILNQMGENADPTLIDDQLLKQSVLEGLIDQEILLQDAEALGLYVSDQSIDGLITSFGQFQVDGQFNNDLFLASIRNFGMTTNKYKEAIKKEVLISQPRNAIVSTAFILEDEFKRVIDIDRQTRSYSLAAFNQADYVDQVEIDDSELMAFYESNVADYAISESVDVEYIQLDKNNLLEKVSVSEEELAKLYELEMEDYQAAEERNSSHILIEVNDKVSEAQAKEKAEELSARIESGESFESLAKEHSDDIGSAAQGGSLGFAARGAYLPEFDEALFTLSKGEVSKPILTEYGYHLIKLHEIQAQPIPTFDEMRFSLEISAKAEKVELLFVELTEQLADLSYASSDLSEPAEELGLAINSQAKVTAQTGESIFANNKVQQAIFSDDVLKDGNNSELIELNADSVVVVRVANHYPSSQQPFEAVRDDVIAKLRAQKATEKASEAAKQAIAALEAGEPVDITWESFEEVNRSDPSKDPELIKVVFSMPKPNSQDQLVLAGVDVNGDYYVAKLDAVNVASISEINESELKTIEQVVGNGFGSAEYQVFQKAIKEKASIEKI
ncbi:SurA N-terminal domain-containing protein [Alkalimarinus sediminis]|uniref:Periplasmic chaperone PpiD n=1 Tax=Alkalimarinus sediminis TaxID=1632866 RepID=A0A9E8HL42_9ALTE|nr:SurA N-terminal domain-containing protein [Alkalimarinus sediminis]UZW76449.1 SurA N-terminal domain-containing protein [Alkalimarinus sediminis]